MPRFDPAVALATAVLVTAAPEREVSRRALTCPDQSYTIYKLAAPRDMRGARRATWSGKLLLADPTASGDVAALGAGWYQRQPSTQAPKAA